ncbi:AAA family ATPase [Flavobacterium antarcticum]|uniref:AAA family ATPase n=1 Tax=Flavobacterium antarcticum TaxID=271155 RepID=UPI0003B3BB16|nr:AAA family ATPase [Flavobacterium antarcticum]
MEKIKHIEISNFKSIKHLEINDCNKINVFIGKPNAGKSNILEALGLFGYLNHPPYSSKISDFVRFNDIYQLCFNGNVKENIRININTRGQLNFTFNRDSIEGPYFKIDGLRYNFISKDGKSSNLVTDADLAMIKKYDYKNIVNQKTGDLSLEFPFGENIGQVISQNQKLRNEVVQSLKDNGLKSVIKSGNYEIAIQKNLEDGTVFELPYNMIADTLQRLIFYKSAIMSNENSAMLFEEPEAHCFEPYILELTNGIKYDEKDNQFFIVTHSDFIVKEFLRDEESKENTNIYLVNNEDGETKVKLLDKNKNEDVFEYGMNIFFNFESLWESN